MTAQDIQTKAPATHSRRCTRHAGLPCAARARPASRWTRWRTYRLPPELQKKLASIWRSGNQPLPGERQEVLKQMLADYAGVRPAHIGAAWQWLGRNHHPAGAGHGPAPCNNERAKMLAPMPGFVMYPLVCQAAGPGFRGRESDERLRPRCAGHAGRHRRAPACHHLYRSSQQSHRHAGPRTRFRP